MAPRFALKQRPDAAFEKLYRGHVHEVYRYALAVLGNPSDAEDVTQTTFLNAYRAFHAGERPRKPTHWLRTIAHNVCRQRFRQAARRPHEVAALDEVAGPAAPEESDAPSAADITRALQSLPFNQRSALVMRELEGRRQVEIAEALGLSESSVEALLFRARRAMREQLETSITCGDASRAISRQLDRSISREERASLRAHLRSCEDCATFARQARAQRGAFKALGIAPLPASLLSWSGGPGAGVAAVAAGTPAVAVALKVAAGVAVVAAIAGAGEAGLRAHATEAASSKPPGTQRDTERVADASARRPIGAPTPIAAARAARISRVQEHRRKLHRSGTAASTRPGRAKPAPSHGTPVRAHGSPSNANGNPTRAHGLPTHAGGAPARAHRSPAGAHPAPPHPAKRPPRRAHGAPTHEPHGQAVRHAAPRKPPRPLRP